jgi:putative ABC transport system ATP-binding protein
LKFRPQKTYHVGDIDVHALRGRIFRSSAANFSRWWVPAGPENRPYSTFWVAYAADLGSIHIDGHDLLAMTEAERTNLRKTGVGFVFQKYNLLPTLTAADNINLYDIAARRAARSAVRRDSGIARAQRQDHHKPRALSGGEQQRVRRACDRQSPAILLADEPPATSIPKTRKRFSACCAI